MSNLSISNSQLKRINYQEYPWAELLPHLEPTINKLELVADFLSSDDVNHKVTLGYGACLCLKSTLEQAIELFCEINLITKP